MFPVKLGNERLGTRLVVTSKSLQIWVHMLRIGKYRHSKFTDGSVARLCLLFDSHQARCLIYTISCKLHNNTVFFIFAVLEAKAQSS